MDYWMVHQKIAQKVGITPAVLLCMLMSKETEFVQQKQIKKGQAFTIIDEEFRKQFNISRRTFDNSIKCLEINGLVATKRFGVPCRKFYLINHEQYLHIAAETRK